MRQLKNGVYGLEGYGGSLDRDLEFTSTVITKEYMYLLTFAMWEYNEFWDDGTLAPEWSDDALTPESVLAKKPVGACVIHKIYRAHSFQGLIKRFCWIYSKIMTKAPHGYIADTLETNTISIIVDEGVVF